MSKLAVVLVTSLVFFNILGGVSFSQTKGAESQFYDTNSPEFWSNVRQIPVQFLDKNKNKTGDLVLSAMFSSNFVAEKIDFILPADKVNRASFFEENKEWEQQIDLKTFLKKFKKNYWLTTYLKVGRENVIISAHQFKNWRSLQASYASDPKQFKHSVNDPDFWKDLRMTLVLFYTVQENKAYWIFLEPLDKTEPVTKEDDQYLYLADNWRLKKRLTATNKLFDFRVIQQGVFYLKDNTVLQQQEMENEKARKVLNVTIFDAKLRLRSTPLDKDYFVKNSAKHFWICFYDYRYQALLRVVESLDHQEQTK